MEHIIELKRMNRGPDKMISDFHDAQDQLTVA